MKTGKFKERLETYGSDFTRWPAGEAEAARRLLAESVEAQRLYREAQDFEGALNSLETPLPSTQLSQRVASIPAHEARAPRQVVSGGLWARFEGVIARPLVPAGAFALALVLVLAVLRPGGPDISDAGPAPVQVAAVETWLEEWDQMAAAVESADELLGLLVVEKADTGPRNGGIDAFLNELESEMTGQDIMPEADVWEYFMAGG